MTNGAPPPAAGWSDAAALPAGCRINEYEIDRTLGGGGFGLTYLARDINLDLPVAVKEYFPADMAQRNPDNSVQVRSQDADVKATYEWGLERFLDEARALATFRHPHIVRVLRYFRENGTAYIVMEYESGQALKRWVPQNAPLSQKAVLSIIYPLLDGLEQVHKAGFLHRDIKPDNIYVRADGGPVLLDFGSARRVQTNRDMTNIVSPGFAPFEQYHSQGNQGPWTDIYSLGAVMYWMVTGKKPMESASRVQKDGMEPASQLAEARVFGGPLLRAIEWAMTPDESKRPQTVAEFRQAIRGAEHPEGDPRTQRTSAAPMAGFAQGASPSGAPSTPSAGQKRNLLGTILFLDLVGYSIKSVDDQVRLKKLFTDLVTKALRGVPEESRIAIDTGDGAAICFMGDPEEALHSALLLRDLLGQRYGTQLSARIGLHMGPVRIIQDINDRLNVIGDGINVAQRVMDFAQPNQVLVSRAYYDVVSRITDDTSGMFVYLGEYLDKHGRPHEVYSVEPAQKAAKEEDAPEKTLTVPAGRPVGDDEAHEIETELARHIGPLAKVLMRKAFPLARSGQALREALAPSIQDPRARELFIAGAPIPISGSHGSTGTSGAHNSKPMSVPFTRPRSAAAPTAPSRPSAAPAAPSRAQPLSQPMSQPMSRPGTVTRVAVEVTPEEQTALEQALSKSIGPLAKMIVKKELGRARSLKEFVNALCENVDSLEQREAFLESARRIFHKRSF
ncbi:protein kinase domain-containing protein [Ramlibacter albus]|uniref:Protein kinase n=1 Tax=Ramlibacter albus TaxID=2079448 RepID=A0A923M5C2_9BURK|nr:protein kinase [Ramlibacter albus]MBC5764235.1 protein kinase [Ramlibacter albus]